MTDPGIGHFVKGEWKKESTPPGKPTDRTVIDKRLADATKAVISSVDEVMKVTHDIVTTEEGKRYIEKTIKETQVHIQKSFDGIVSRVKEELDKGVKSVK